MSKLLDKLVKETSLETRLRVSLEIDDYENWNNGKYYGVRDKLVPLIIDEVKQWILDEAPLLQSESTEGTSDASESCIYKTVRESNASELESTEASVDARLEKITEAEEVFKLFLNLPNDDQFDFGIQVQYHLRELLKTD